MIAEVSKYWNIQVDINGPAIILFHHYQKLVTDSRKDAGINPYPYVSIANFDMLVKAIQQIAKNLAGR